MLFLLLKLNSVALKGQSAKTTERYIFHSNPSGCFKHFKNYISLPDMSRLQHDRTPPGFNNDHFL